MPCRQPEIEWHQATPHTATATARPQPRRQPITHIQQTKLRRKRKISEP